MVLILYSVTNSKSLEEVYSTVEIIRDIGDPSILICLLGTKVDAVGKLVSFGEA